MRAVLAISASAALAAAAAPPAAVAPGWTVRRADACGRGRLPRAGRADPLGPRVRIVGRELGWAGLSFRREAHAKTCDFACGVRRCTDHRCRSGRSNHQWPSRCGRHSYVGELIFFDADFIDSRFDDLGGWFSC
jgi:hypothetical protein